MIQLCWPVVEPVIITQPFGARPEYYRRFIVNGVALPGHEGIDFRAVTGAPVLAVADGRVKLVATSGNYGYQIRIQHLADETLYESIYAHGQSDSALVKAGADVSAGQVIMKADSTGNVQGAHLHLTIKCRGATARGETPYPSDIIDPTPLFPSMAPALAQHRRITAKPAVRVRREPSMNAVVVGRIVNGAEVVILSVQGTWGLIADPFAGWIDLQWTEVVE